MQPVLFEFPLQMAVFSGDGSVRKLINIKEKITTLKITSQTKPTQLMADPETNLLFEGTVKENL